MALTAAWVNITIANTVTMQDAFQFGTAGDTTWSFTGQSFHVEVKASREDTTSLLSLTSAAGQIVVDNAVTRVLHFNVPEATIQGALPVADYVYDLVMFDGSTPPVRTLLMQGHLFVRQGVTES